MKNLKNLFKKYGLTFGLVVVAFVLGLLFSSGRSDSKNTSHTAHSGSSQVWTCSMHPNVQLPSSGQCPICFMDLILMEKESGDGINPDHLKLSEAAVKLAEIKTDEVKYGKADLSVHLSGKVAYDESRVGKITAWVPGRVERMFVDYTGITVNAGDKMIEMYSPDLYAAQEELLQAQKLVQRAKSQPASFQETLTANLDAAREKLKLMGLVDSQISAIEAGESPSDIVAIFSPMSGVVIQKNGIEGAYVKTGTNLYTIADLNQVWVILDAYETDLPWLALGQHAAFTTEGIPGKSFEGKIAFIDPVVDEKTRTVKVRINVSNPTGTLKPGMFVHGLIHASTDRKEILIPASAVLKTGNRAIVYVQMDQDEPTFEGREIILGPRMNGHYVVDSGLTPGEKIVVKGNFKIDSAMQISAKASMMNPKPAKNKPMPMEHQH